MRLLSFSPLRRFPSLASPRLPLPITATAIALLVALPLAALQRLPRPRAQGLEQLLEGVALLQSFPATPQRPVPSLWRQRLGGPLSERAWRQQRGFWWQLWGENVASQPMLVLPASSLPTTTVARLPSQAMRLADLVVVAPDPLALQMLRTGIKPQQRRSRGLQRRCLERLQNSQAVFWNQAALGVIAGAMAPLLQLYQSGCLSVGLDGTDVIWSGEASAVDGVLSQLNSQPNRLETPLQQPLPADQLLQIRGSSLDLLIQGLLVSQLIRDPLASRYGIDNDRLALLRQAPFELRLRPLAKGPYQASLELQLLIGKQQAAWNGLLNQLARSLQAQGLKQQQSQAVNGSSTWSQANGGIVGGWRWLPAVGGQLQLLLFLGPVPQPPLTRIGGANNPLPLAGLQLRSRPADLAALEMLPADLPELVKRASQLQIEAQSLKQGSGSVPFNQLSGRLQLPR